MRKICFALFAILVACFVAGCGGSSVPSAVSDTYNGTYTPTGGKGAVMITTVSSVGSISGTVVDTVSGQTTYNATGSLSNGGNFYLQAPSSAGTDYFAGPVSISSSGMLTGKVQESGQVSQVVNLLLQRE